MIQYLCHTTRELKIKSARSVANVSITLGLLNIPSKLYLSASSEDFSFKQLSPSGERLTQQYVDPNGVVVSREEMTRGYEINKDEFVIFSQEEIKTLQSDGTAIQLNKFIPMEKLPSVYIEKAYYVKPDPKQFADKQYSLIAKILKKKNLVAIGTWVFRGKDKLVALAAHEDGLILYQLYFKNEVRGFDLSLRSVNISEPEMQMAELLVSTMTDENHDLGQYQDHWNVRVNEAVENKRNGTVVSTALPQRKDNSVDLFEALKQMLAGQNNKTAELAPAPIPVPLQEVTPVQVEKKKRSTKKNVDKSPSDG